MTHPSVQCLIHVAVVAMAFYPSSCPEFIYSTLQELYCTVHRTCLGDPGLMARCSIHSPNFFLILVQFTCRFSRLKKSECGCIFSDFFQICVDNSRKHFSKILRAIGCPLFRKHKPAKRRFLNPFWDEVPHVKCSFYLLFNDFLTSILFIRLISISVCMDLRCVFFHQTNLMMANEWLIDGYNCCKSTNVFLHFVADVHS